MIDRQRLALEVVAAAAREYLIFSDDLEAKEALKDALEQLDGEAMGNYRKTKDGRPISN